MDSWIGGMLGLKGTSGITHLLDQLTDEETEAQAEGVVCSSSYGWQEPEPGVWISCQLPFLDSRQKRDQV